MEKYEGSRKIQEIIGLTGREGIDGILSDEQETRLNDLQYETAMQLLSSERGSDEPFAIAAMATGIGKGNIIHRIIESMKMSNPQLRVLLIAGTKRNLVDQSIRALTAYQGSEEEIIDIDIEDDEFKGYTVGYYGKEGGNEDVQIATMQGIQSAYTRGTLKPEEFDLLIIDEVHNIGTRRRLDAIKGFRKIIGFTATPYRSSGKYITPDDYGFEVVKSYPLPLAQEERLLPPLYGVQINTAEGIPDIRIPVLSNGKIDYTNLEKELKKHPDLHRYIASRLIPIINEEGKEYKTIIAVNYVWEAQALALEIQKQSRDQGKQIRVGIAINKNDARTLDSEEIPAIDSIERYRLPMSDPKSLQVLISPYVTGEGFDAPFTEVLAWASPTDSGLRYTQVTGRVTRRHNGKLFGIVVDFLYQTNQYNWSYNMAMWMKGNVRVLPNGQLYMGPLSIVRNQDELDRLSRLSSQVGIEELTKKGIEDIKDGEIGITVSSLQNIFVGEYKKIMPLIKKVMDRIEKEDPERYADLFQRRRNGASVITVATDTNAFIDLMQKEGLILKDSLPEEIKDGEFGITDSGLQNIFVGGPKKVIQLIKKVMDRIEKEDPKRYADLFQLRRNGPHVITVATDTNAFIDLMQKEGLILKDSLPEEIKDGEIGITVSGMQNIFVGEYKKIKPFIKKVMDRIKKEDPKRYADLFQRRRNGTNVITVATDTNEFIDLMQKEGLILKDSLPEEVKDGEFGITDSGLQNIFVGGPKKVIQLIKKVMDRIEKEDPERYADLFQRRRNGTNVITVATDTNAFIDLMQKEGLILRNSLPEEIRDGEIGITDSGLENIFVGGRKRIMPLIKKVMDRIEKEDPKRYADLFQRRRNGSHVITVATDTNEFIQLMQKEGLVYRENSKK